MQPAASAHPIGALGTPRMSRGLPIDTPAKRLCAARWGAVAALASAALLSPASALSARQPRVTAAEPAVEGSGPAHRRQADAAPGGPCSVTLTVASARLAAGESAALSGTLSCPTAEEAAEQTVTIYEHAVGTPGFAAAGTAASGADGSFQLDTQALETNGVLYAAARRAHSPRVWVGVGARVSLEGPPSGTQLLIVAPRAGAGAPATNTVTFKGTVSPVEAGTRVVLQRESQGRWRRVGLGEVGLDGSYSIAHTFRAGGEATIRAVVRLHGKALSASEPLSYLISKRQIGARIKSSVGASAPVSPHSP